MKRAEILAIAALIVSGYEFTPRKRRPPVQKMVTSSNDEIKAWNAAVDARKAAKKEQQP